MKFILLVLAVLVLIWLVKGSVARRMPPPRGGRSAPPVPQPMVTCAQCGLHLPRTDALPGRGGVFCGEAHRAEYERSHPTA